MLTLIAALDRNRAIGVGGRLPWYLPDDLKRFKALTLGKPILMGRKTAQPMPGMRARSISSITFASERCCFCRSGFGRDALGSVRRAHEESCGTSIVRVAHATRARASRLKPLPQSGARY